VRESWPVLIKFGLIGKSNGSSIAASSDASQAGSSMDVDATQAGSFASLYAGEATKICEIHYSLLAGGRQHV
jgi:hypothetical protein